MKRSRFTETQIVSILKEAAAGMQVKCHDPWRWHRRNVLRSNSNSLLFQRIPNVRRVTAITCFFPGLDNIVP